MKSLRLGIVGLGHAGTHHLERMSLRADLEIVAACRFDGESAQELHPRHERVLCRADELLARNDLDFLLIAVPPPVQTRLAIRSFESGKNVALDSPPCADAREMRDLMTAAESAGRVLCILPSRRDGFDFRAAAKTVRDGHLGEIESARLISWAKAVPGDAADLARSPGGSPSSVDANVGDAAFGFFAFQYVDQLLQLIRCPPRTVFAKVGRPLEDDPTAAVFSLSVGFADGADALIDVNLHSGAALQTGWMLSGTRGAYCQQRLYVPDPSGEICDAPVSPTDVPELDPYVELLESTRTGLSRRASTCDAETVLRVIDAARESSCLGEVVRLDEPDGKRSRGPQ